MKLGMKLAMVTGLMLCSAAASADIWYDVVQWHTQFWSVWYEAAQ